MPFYNDADQLYDIARDMFARLQKRNPGAADPILKSRLVAHLKCTDPSAELTLNGRRRPVDVTYGPSSSRPMLDIALPADLLHSILLDKVSLMKAMGSGELVVKGNVLKAKALADLFHNSQEIYTEILCERGLMDIRA
jgi:hypothetical protein